MDTDMRQPDQVLARPNDAFPSARHGQKFFTAWYGVYKRSTGLLTWSGGGHHPSILLAPGARDPILLPSSGMIIGFMSGQEYPAESCEVAAGARLSIFSDGVFEIFRDGQPVWDMEACIEYLARRDSRGGALMDELLAHVLWYKRLEVGVFKMPRVEQGARAVELRASELAMILDGIDVSKLKRVPRYERAVQSSK
jgi:serine phosphatase RsbU (regulator of sigma subunit)